MRSQKLQSSLPNNYPLSSQELYIAPPRIFASEDLTRSYPKALLGCESKKITRKQITILVRHFLLRPPSHPMHSETFGGGKSRDRHVDETEAQ